MSAHEFNMKLVNPRHLLTRNIEGPPSPIGQVALENSEQKASNLVLLIFFAISNLEINFPLCINS